MLMQTLESQGCDVTWLQRLPPGVPSNDATANEKAACWIKSVTMRPGQRLKQLTERPKVAPTDKAAIVRRQAKALPKRFFEQLKGRPRRPKLSSTCYNKFTAPSAVALVQRERLTSFIETKLRCGCGSHVSSSDLNPWSRSLKYPS